ncbi:hypothetical protein [Pelomonas sp. Root1444]|uniref:hypothetical protein n=1 Tax=Pelomonas sp. Root1444 TaxID=1736464 RepID=UPI0007029D3D|nr:hypothetical protein [Pelomonas sp. Root1444]KQY81810.1 hypothetical protein ASD35_08465 [Pelomonas sp. Root1444]
MPWGAAIMAVGTLASSAVQSSAAKKAVNAQQAATDTGMAEQRRQYDQTREDFAPWRDAGKTALTTLVEDMDKPTTTADVMSDPGYQFGMQQGQRALGQRIAAGGGRVSGAALKAATRFGTDYASTGYNSAYQRKQERLRRLENIAGLGQTATGGTASAGTSTTNALTSLITSQGDANAGYHAARGGIWGNAINQLAAMGSRSLGDGPGGGYGG